MIKLKDIAEKVGVTVATVSYALNNDPRLPDSTKQKIILTAQEMGYQGKSGRSVSKDTVKQVVLCINSFSGGIFKVIVEAMKETFALHNCQLLIYTGTEISKLKWMDGMIILNSRIPSAEIEKLVSKNIPIVLMDRELNLHGTVNVTLDNFNGCFQTTQSAIDKGAKTFAFIGGPKESYESHYRYDGFCKALEANGLSDKNAIVLQTDFTYQGGISTLRFMLERGIIPDAIVCANDETAMGIIDGLKKGNVTKDVIVTGFDGVINYTSPTRFVTAKADHKHWATTSSYTMIQLFDRNPAKSIKLPVQIVEHNM